MSARKGISPLIAMVLIITFLAAILMMVLSWRATHRLEQKEVCSTVSFEITKQEDAPPVCLDREAGKVRLTVQNSGEQPIDNIRFVYGETTTEEDGIPSGGLAEYAFDVPADSDEALIITPLFKVEKTDEKILECLNNSIIVPAADLREC